jgi:hypothetical protein
MQVPTRTLATNTVKTGMVLFSKRSEIFAAEKKFVHLTETKKCLRCTKAMVLFKNKTNKGMMWSFLSLYVNNSLILTKNIRYLKLNEKESFWTTTLMLRQVKGVFTLDSAPTMTFPLIKKLCLS